MSAKAAPIHQDELARPQLVRKAEPKIEWAEYSRIDPGKYQAVSVHVHSYWDRRFVRNVCAVYFDVLNEWGSAAIARLPLFLNLGDKKGQPRAGRCSMYWQVWIMANGGRRPFRGDRMTAAIFKNRSAVVEVADTTREIHLDFDGKKVIYRQIPTVEPYSTIKRLIRWETASASHQVNKSTQAGDKPTQGKGL